jgi:hypothetical protein
VDKETGNLIQWLAAPLATIGAVWLTNVYNLRKEKDARDYAFRKEIYESVLREIVSSHQLLAAMITDLPSEGKRLKSARGLGQAISAVQLVAGAETVRLLQSYSLQINQVTFELALDGFAVAEKKRRFELADEGRREACLKDYHLAMVKQFEKVAPVLEKLVNDAVPSILAIRQELAIDTDAELFEQVTKQFATEGKALLDHIGLEIKRHAGLLPIPQVIDIRPL